MRTIEPTYITRGERVEWRRSFSDYPATEWELQYRFRGPGPGGDVDATADGDRFIAEITAAASAIFVAGKYQWQAWVTEIADSTNTFSITGGYITVEQGFVEGETGDIETRTPAKITLDAIDAALLAFGTTDIVEYEITTPSGSRKVKRSDKVELMSQRKYWAAIVGNELAKAKSRKGLGFGTKIDVRFYD